MISFTLTSSPRLDDRCRRRPKFHRPSDGLWRSGVPAYDLRRARQRHHRRGRGADKLWGGRGNDVFVNAVSKAAGTSTTLRLAATTNFGPRSDTPEPMRWPIIGSIKSRVDQKIVVSCWRLKRSKM